MSVKLVVVNCQESQLSKDFAYLLKSPLIQAKIRKFADTEIYVDIKETDFITEAHVLFPYQFSLLSNQSESSLNEQFIAFLLTADLIKNLGAKKIIAILPYLPYSRQELSFSGKCAGPLKLWGDFLQSAGINELFVCDPHSEQVVLLLTPKTKEIDLSKFWSEFIQTNFKDELHQNNLCIASPDKGGIKRANKIADILNIPLVWIEKKRLAPDTPIALTLKGDVSGKFVIIVDDILDTGKTALQACSLLKTKGATDVASIFTHAVFSKGSFDRLTKSAFSHVFISDTLLLEELKFKQNKISIHSINRYLIEKVLKDLR